MIYVLREGVLVPKGSVREAQATQSSRADFPTPRLSRLEPYASPIDGHEVTSWGERDREMKANNAYDPRDVSREPGNVRPEPKSDQLTLPFID
jgi:hypothetical protein